MPAHTRFALLEEISGAYFAKDDEQQSVLLIPLESSRTPSDRTTGGVGLEFHRAVTFETPLETFVANAAILRCKVASLEPTFRVMASDVATRVDASIRRPSALQVSQALASWEELLRAARRMTPEEEIGLWGELQVILMASDADAALRAWCGPDKAAVDFCAGGVGIESKTTRTRLRHHFSMSQVGRVLGDVPSYFLSMWVGEDDVDGETINDLITAIEVRGVDTDMLERKLLKAGYSRADADAYALRLVLLEAPLWFGQDEVPRITAADPGVSGIRYTATLDPALALAPADGQRILAALAGAAEATL